MRLRSCSWRGSGPITAYECTVSGEIKLITHMHWQMDTGRPGIGSVANAHHTHSRVTGHADVRMYGGSVCVCFHSKSYFEVTTWLYLSVWVVYFLFQISFLINTFLLFILTDLRTRNTQEHKRQDLSHEPITAEHNQSYPVIWQLHSTINSQWPPTKPSACFKGSF